MKNAATAALLSLSLSGCIAFRAPSNEYDLGGTQGYMAQRASQAKDTTATLASVVAQNQGRCHADPIRANLPPVAASTLAGDMPLSAGDLVHVSVSGDESPAGTYKINNSGVLALTAVGDMQAAGLTVSQAETDLDRLLTTRHIFRRGYAHAALRVLDRGPARIVVTGAVFQPGQVVINERAPNVTDTVRETAIGDHALGRTLSIALSHAAGVRPDADLAHITIQHEGAARLIDLSGILSGDNTEDPMLAEGDHVMVPSLHCFQQALARPTPITPPGVKIFVSNLTAPANNNAGAAVGADATSLAYGTRLLQALVGANCVGGTQITNADRWAVLISSNPATGESEVVERQVEKLVRGRDRDAYNPVLMPGDAIACYDSNVQNVRDVLISIGNLGIAASAGRVVSGL